MDYESVFIGYEMLAAYQILTRECVGSVWQRLYVSSRLCLYTYSLGLLETSKICLTGHVFLYMHKHKLKNGR